MLVYDLRLGILATGLFEEVRKDMSSQFNFIDRIRSFRFAFAGILTMFKTQHNCWIHLLATVIVVGMGLFFKVSVQDWSLLVLAIIVVWAAEGFNTAIEFLADVASPDFHPQVKKAKDVAAGAVLISAIGAAVVGLYIFVPHLLS